MGGYERRTDQRSGVGGLDCPSGRVPRPGHPGGQGVGGRGSGVGYPSRVPFSADPLWRDRTYLREEQYRSDVNLRGRQSIYEFRTARLDLARTALDLAFLDRAGLAGDERVVDVGCGNGRYIAALAARGHAGDVVALDLSAGMLQGLEPPRGGGSGTVHRCVADAAALGLRTACAGVTIAAHMLYHVADPRAAVRELRRVTQPAGRVVVVLNHHRHLAELRALFAEAAGDSPDDWGSPESVTLDDGAGLLGEVFSTVERTDLPGQLRVSDPAVLVRYGMSVPHRSGATSEHPGFAATVERIASERIRRDGAFVVTAHPGVLICR